jgi:cysteinyl-tRNA synthetase
MTQTPLQLFNSLTRSLETFTPVHAGEARVYSCGPTVYNYPHIGNMRAYVFADVLGRCSATRATSSPMSSTSPMSAT